MKRLFSCVIACSLGIGNASGDNNSVDPPSYEVKRTDAAPAIDGYVSEGEWDIASPAASSWVGLLDPALDTDNTRFRMMWDDENLYVLGETDYANFGDPKDFVTQNPESDPAVYVPRMILDPNADGEDWSSPEFNPAEPDGYSILWSVSEGFAARRPTPGNPDQAYRDPLVGGEITADYIAGFELEANVNSLSGNVGGWDITDEGVDNYRDNKHPGITFAQLAIDTPLDETEQPGGVFEFSIAWSAFNATDPNSGNPLFDPESEEFLENGLYHPMAPQENDVWGFEMGVRDPDNALPSWSEPMGGNEARQEFADWNAQHGRLIFTVAFPEYDCDKSGAVDVGDLTCMTAETRDPTLEILNLVLGDFNASGKVDFADFVVFNTFFGQQVDNYTLGDITLDGVVNFFDFTIFSAKFGQSSAPEAAAASVPEPGGFALLALGALALGRRRRSRR